MVRVMRARKKPRDGENEMVECQKRFPLSPPEELSESTGDTKLGLSEHRERNWLGPDSRTSQRGPRDSRRPDKGKVAPHSRQTWDRRGGGHATSDQPESLYKASWDIFARSIF